MLVVKIDKRALQAQRQAERKAIMRHVLWDAIALAGMVASLIALYVILPN